MIMQTPTARISRVWTYRQIGIREHAPGTDHFDALRLIRVDQKVVSNRNLVKLKHNSAELLQYRISAIASSARHSRQPDAAVDGQPSPGD